MIHKHDAILATYPNVVIVRGDEAFDANGNVVIYNANTVQAYIDANAYKINRQYPSITDQLDMLWHAMDNNEIPRANTFYTAIQTVKNAHPKS